MSFLSFIPIIGKALEKGLDIVDDLVEDKDKANELKAAIRQQVLVQQHDQLVNELEAQSKIILAEARGGFLQRNWRPLTMMIFVLIVANNYLIFPYISMWTDKAIVLEFPSAFWGLLTIGIGGYIGSKTVERIKGVRPDQK